MDLKIIVDKINSGEYGKPKRLKLYEDNHVFDENKSVKWNREKVSLENKEIKATNYAPLINQFKEDVIAYILSNYEINNNKEMAETIYCMAWKSGHSYGLYYVLQEAVEFAEFARDMDLTAFKN